MDGCFGGVIKGQEMKDIPVREREIERNKVKNRMEKAVCAWGGQNT